MMTRNHALILSLVASCSLVAFSAGWQTRPKPRPTAQRLTYGNVASILKASCVGCHQGAKPAHGANLASYKAIMKGDKEGRIVVPGQPSKSRLATVLRGKPKLMPPGHALPPATIGKIEAWIKAGAREK